MGRRKSAKRRRQESIGYFASGLLFILIAIFGVGLGVVGNLIKKGAMFLFGEWWFVLLFILLILGLYLFIKREMPLFFESKLVGFYLAIIVLLVASHFTLLATNKPIIDTTLTNYQNRISTISNDAPIMATGQKSIDIGGGIVGAAFLNILYVLFAKVGTIIILVVMGILAIVLLFDVDFGEIVDNLKEKMEREEVEGDDEDIDITDEEVEEKLSKTVSLKSLFGKKKKGDKDVNPAELAEAIKEETPAPIPETHPVNAYRLPIEDVDRILDKDTSSNTITANASKIKAVGDKLVAALKSFDIESKVVDTHVGPAVTQYELEVPVGTKVSKILNINKEIALALAAKDVRIEAPIPGKSTVGVEIPNGEISAVRIKDILKSINKSSGIQVALGKDLMGNYRTCDITKMPHLLIAGSTGSGKSVCTNSIIISILMRYRPDEVKLVLIDPKQVELSNYNGIPHLLLPVVTDPKKASATLQRIVAEMDDRYRTFANNSVKKIDDYNAMIERKNQGKEESEKIKKMPYIVVIIDEMADLMVVARKEVEDSIMRITQLARAAGIHLLTATQRPSTDIITGVIKANIPSRIAFAVASQVDSRTILDGVGAEKLLGKGDMLFLPMGQNTADRIQGCFVSDDEIARVISAVKDNGEATYDENFANIGNESTSEGGSISSASGIDDDPLYNEIYEFALEQGKVSASLIQRRFRLGYNRAARIIDTLEERGVIGPQNGSKPREVLVGKEEDDE